MNALTEQKSDLETIFPEGKVVIIPLPGGQTEELRVMPLPLGKWKKGIAYIVQIAPLLGFNQLSQLAAQQAEGESSDLLDTSQPLSEEKLQQIAEQNMPELGDLKDRILEALLGEASELILDFVAYAIDKDRAYLDARYDEIIDIVLAVVEVNLNFFVRHLLPKILAGTRQLTQVAQQVRLAVKR
jgi:hypothetical protein